MAGAVGIGLAASSERSAAAAHLLWEQGAAGSIPAAPTMIFPPGHSVLSPAGHPEVIHPDCRVHGAIVQRENTAFARRKRGFDSHWLHHGEMAERLIAAVLKTAEGDTFQGFKSPSLRHMLLLRAREPRGLAWSSRPDFPCLSMLRAASIGEAAFLFPSAPAPRGEQAKAADSLPKRDRKAARRAVPVTTKEVTGIDSRA